MQPRKVHRTYTFPPGSLLAGTIPMLCSICGPKDPRHLDPLTTIDQTQVTCKHCLAKMATMRIALIAAAAAA